MPRIGRLSITSINAVNIYGDLYRYSGYGYLVRETIKALRAAGLTVKCQNMFSDTYGHIGAFPDFPHETPIEGAPDLFVVPPCYALKSANGFLYSMVEAYPAPRAWCLNVNVAGMKAVFTTSDFCKKALIDGGVESPVHNVYNVFEPESLPAAPKCDDSCYFKSLKPYAIYSGSALMRKGVDLLFEVARLCPEIRFVIKLNLVDGVTVPLSRELIDAPNVSLMVGTMIREQLAHLYAHADAGLYLARCDTISKFPMELAHYGVPCITGNHSGLSEWTPPEFTVRSTPVRAGEVYDGLTWWEPDITAAAAILKKIVGGKIRYSRNDELAKFAPKEVARKIITIMEEYQ